MSELGCQATVCSDFLFKFQLDLFSILGPLNTFFLYSAIAEPDNSCNVQNVDVHILARCIDGHLAG